jgi:RES domain-containing protein
MAVFGVPAVYMCSSISQEMLRTNRMLKELNLLGNNVGDAGTKFIADALTANSVLEKLDLSRNNIRRDVRDWFVWNYFGLCGTMA